MLSSLGRLIAREMKWEGKRRGGGLEQGEMERWVATGGGAR